jgi:hypothetical protein
MSGQQQQMALQSAQAMPTFTPETRAALDEMTPNKALDVLVQAVYVGQSRGAWRLEEVPILLRAIEVFAKNLEQKPAEGGKN